MVAKAAKRSLVRRPTGPDARSRRGSKRTEAIEVLARFRIIFRSARQHYQSVESELGISGAQLRALALIAADEGNGVTALARAMLVRQPTASNLVRALIERDLLAMERRPGRRGVALTIRPAGRRVLAAAPRPFSGVLPRALAGSKPGRGAHVGNGGTSGGSS